MYTYTILQNANQTVFRHICSTIESSIPNIKKDALLEDVDGTQIQIYVIQNGKIKVYNDCEIDAVYIDSEIDLENIVKTFHSTTSTIRFFERISKMRNGEKIKCSRCQTGYFSAVGNPQTTLIFRCDCCQTGMVLTVPHHRTPNRNALSKHLCPCGYEYDPAKGDPENGIAPGTKWEDLPEDFVCPICGLDKDAFEEQA